MDFLCLGETWENALYEINLLSSMIIKTSTNVAYSTLCIKKKPHVMRSLEKRALSRVLRLSNRAQLRLVPVLSFSSLRVVG